MASKQTKSKQFIESSNDIVQIVTANKSDSSDDHPANKKDMVILDAASPNDDDEVIVTINNARAECNEDTFILQT